MQIDRMEKVDRPVFERRKMALALRSGQRGGQRVLALEGVDAGYGDEPVLLDVELVVGRGERVGVVGPNGGGKTTLLRVLTEELAPLDGTRWAGDGITLGYLSQAARVAVGRGDRARRAARRPIPGRGRRGAAADGVPVRLRADPPSGRLVERRRAHAACFPVPDAGRAELPRARRADEPPRHRLDRGPRRCAGALRRDRDRRLPRPLLPRPDRRPDRARGRRRGAGATKAAGPPTRTWVRL